MSRALLATDLRAWALEQRDMAPHLDVLKACAREARTIVELGVRGAVSTWAFLEGLPADGRLWSVDIRAAHVPPRVSRDRRWRFVLGDDRNPATWRFLPRTADLVFIDTSHEYEHTTLELRHAAALSPSRILCHDAQWPGVERAIAEFGGWGVAAFYPAADAKGDFSLAILEPVG